MILHIKYLNSARHIINAPCLVTSIFLEFGRQHVCSSLLFFFFLIWVMNVTYISSECITISLLLDSVPRQMGKWRTRKIGPVVSEGEEKPGLLGFPAPCFILCSTHLSTWLKHCVFSSNIAICGRWLNTYLIFLDLIVEVNHRKISVLCYLIYSVLSKCQFIF